MNLITKILSIFKRSDSKEKKVKLDWDQLMTKLSQSEENGPLIFPVLYLTNGIDWDFETYTEPEDLINESIAGQWGMYVRPKDNSEKDVVIDSSGKIYEMDDHIFNPEFKIGYSFPKRFIGNKSMSELKTFLINGRNEYIELFDPKHGDKIIKGTELIKKAESIKSIISIVYDYPNFSGLEKT